MSNKPMSLSKKGKELLDLFVAELEIQRPVMIKIAFAKGFASEESVVVDTSSTPKWTIPDGIIKGDDYLLFKHLLIEEKQVALNNEDISKHLLFYIEKGLRLIENKLKHKNSLQDARIVIFS